MRLGKVDLASVRHHMRHHAGRAKHHTVRAARAVHRHALSTPRRIAITVVFLAIVPIVIVQLIYPTTSVVPNTNVGLVEIGGLSKEEATTRLNNAYAMAKVPVYFTDSDEVVFTPTLSNIGFAIDNKARVDAYDYPFGWRLVPWSLFWYEGIMAKGEPVVSQNTDVLERYVLERVGEDCEFSPINATIVFRDGALQVEEASRGGSCDRNELATTLRLVTASLRPQSVEVEGVSTPPDITTEVAFNEYDRLSKIVASGLPLKVEDATETVPQATLIQWVEYTADGNNLKLGLNADKVKEWINTTYADKFVAEPGTTIVTTRDFAEVSRETGRSGQTVDALATIDSLTKSLSGDTTIATLAIETVEPKVTYNRSYSSTDTGLSAVMKNFASSHPGTYGVKLVELSGARRNAEYNSTTQFITASTYKLFVAYSTLLRIEKGEWQWDDTLSEASNKTITKCFDDMIKLSDNACAKALLHKVGFKAITNEAVAIGATKTSFLGKDGIKSTAGDEALFLSLLYTGQLLSQQSSRDRLISAMKQNVYRKGIPTGIPGATVADKVGFLDGLLHDASIVYSPTGDYVLVILTNNSSWANIAELTKQLEALRNKA